MQCFMMSSRAHGSNLTASALGGQRAFIRCLQSITAGLFKGIFKKRGFACYDMFMTIEPVLLITMFVAMANAAVLLYGLMFMPLTSNIILIPLYALIRNFASYYLGMFALGLVTTICAWKKIRCNWTKKVLYLFTFPIFLASNMPISLIAFFKNVRWDPIVHDISIPVTKFTTNKVA